MVGSAIESWLIKAMLAWIPATPVPPRYEAIAKDIVAVAFESGESPLFSGPHGRSKTALSLAAIASFESQFREDVDDGKARGKLGEVCILQVLLPSPKHRIVMSGDTYSYSLNEGWSYDDLVADRRKCVKAALHKARESWRACHNLSLYTSGACDKDEPKAKHRQWRAEHWWRREPAPFADDDVRVE